MRFADLWLAETEERTLETAMRDHLFFLGRRAEQWKLYFRAWNLADRCMCLLRSGTSSQAARSDTFVDVSLGSAKSEFERRWQVEERLG